MIPCQDSEHRHSIARLQIMELPGTHRLCWVSLQGPEVAPFSSVATEARRPLALSEILPPTVP